MKRKMIHYATNFLHECGIKMSQDVRYSKTWRLFAMGGSFLMIIVLSIVFSILNRDDFYKLISAMPFSAATFTSLSAAATVFHFKGKISEMFHQMDDNFYTYPDEDAIAIKYPWYLREENVVRIMKAILLLHYVMVTAVTIPGLGELVVDGKIKTFLYPSWVPWRVDGVKSELFTILFQYFTLSCGGTLNMINVLTLYVSFFEFLRQHKRLVAAVASLQRRSVEIAGKSAGLRHEEVLRENIVHCVRHYQVQHKNLRLFETWFSEYFSFELAVYVMSFSFGLFVTMHASSLEKVINQLGVIMYTNFSIFLKCLIGDVLVEMNDDLAYALFSQVEWYEGEAHNRKLIQLFHVFVQSRRVKLAGFSIFHINLMTFAAILRSAYSLFNVMNLTMK